MIVILGGSGMLGSMMTKALDMDFQSFSRPEFDAEDSAIYVNYGDTVINCVGVIKPYCFDVERAIKVNSLFPYTLPHGSLQIATDCVYSGSKGKYVETDPHDATDVYGKTKSLGEADHLHNLRCSIIGPEQKSHLSLLDWFLSQEVDEVKGFTNHLWNGITTLHFARICQGIIREEIELPPLQHIVPADVVTKAELLQLIADAYGKKIKIVPTEADQPVDRTLATHDPALNRVIWQAAGYKQPPTIKQMIEELSQS